MQSSFILCCFFAFDVKQQRRIISEPVMCATIPVESILGARKKKKKPTHQQCVTITFE